MTWTDSNLDEDGRTGLRILGVEEAKKKKRLGASGLPLLFYLFFFFPLFLFFFFFRSFFFFLFSLLYTSLRFVQAPRLPCLLYFFCFWTQRLYDLTTDRPIPGFIILYNLIFVLPPPPPPGVAAAAAGAGLGQRLVNVRDWAGCSYRGSYLPAYLPTESCLFFLFILFLFLFLRGASEIC